MCRLPDTGPSISNSPVAVAATRSPAERPLRAAARVLSPRRAAVSAHSCLLAAMDALFDRFHNFILPLVRGEDGVCGCTCGRHQVYHVVPYNGAQSMVDSRENKVLSDIMTWQEMNVVVGLLLGFCISFFLQWLERIWHSRLKYTENQMSGVGFWSWMPTFSKIKELVRQLHPQRMRLQGQHAAHQSRCES